MSALSTIHWIVRHERKGLTLTTIFAACLYDSITILFHLAGKAALEVESTDILTRRVTIPKNASRDDIETILAKSLKP